MQTINSLRIKLAQWREDNRVREELKRVQELELYAEKETVLDAKLKSQLVQDRVNMKKKLLRG